MSEDNPLCVRRQLYHALKSAPYSRALYVATPETGVDDLLKLRTAGEVTTIELTHF